MHEFKQVGLSITLDQRDEIVGLGLPYGLYPSLLTLLLLANWRSKIQPDIVNHFTVRGVGGKQHVCKVSGHCQQLYDWFRQTYPGCFSRAIVGVGLNTIAGLLQQGYSIGQIANLANEERKAIWGL